MFKSIIHLILVGLALFGLVLMAFASFITYIWTH